MGKMYNQPGKHLYNTFQVDSFDTFGNGGIDAFDNRKKLKQTRGPNG